jgi:CheY-like chemotaxis protein
MISKELEQLLREALAGLHDSSYQPPPALCELLGCNSADGALPVQAALIRAIETLQPPADTPPLAHSRQVHDLLYGRWVLKLTWGETAERLHMSLSSVQRAQNSALYTLAQILWDRRAAERQPALLQADGPAAAEEQGEAPNWRSQVERELAALQESAPDAVCDTGETIAGVLELVRAAGPSLGVDVEAQSVQPGLIAAVHPGALRQTLLTAVRELAQHTENGHVVLRARLESGKVKIALTGRVAPASRLSKELLIANVLTTKEMVLHADLHDRQAFLWIELPSVGALTVLVVDDNPDMVRFYQRSTEGTRYHIVHVAHEQTLFDSVTALHPDVIVLDVMLPAIDGWHLLMRLHDDPATRTIPVIVCSVVKEEALAMSLGAALYLPKPVRHSEFTAALDRVLHPA